MIRVLHRLGSVAVALAGMALVAGGCAQLDQAAGPATGSGSTPAAKPVSEPATKPKVESARKPVTRNRPAPTHAEAATGAAAQLETLVVAGRAPMSGYDRDRFGQAWLDADRNGCDTRNDVLHRDLQSVALRPGTHGCVVLTGVLADPYTRARIDFVRGDGYSVDIDHVVALGNAWTSGAWRFDITERAALANDPLNLLAVDAGANRSKGDSNAASWLPPNKPFRCAYVARQVAVKSKYHLTVTPSEKAQIDRQLSACPGQPVTPDVTHAPTRVDQHLREPGRPEASPAVPRSGGSTVHYENCDAARAAGAAPVQRGDPGYGPHLDRDGDGSTCE